MRLLGDLLGRVLVEQEGEELLATEEHIRKLARDARRTGEVERVREAVRAVAPEQQVKVLRAFALYFQLANIAEQHHRLRRRRQYADEDRAPRESLAEAFERIGGRRPEHISLELVLTAHPTEATRRTILVAHVRITDLIAAWSKEGLRYQGVSWTVEAAFGRRRAEAGCSWR